MNQVYCFILTKYTDCFVIPLISTKSCQLWKIVFYIKHTIVIIIFS